MKSILCLAAAATALLLCLPTASAQQAPPERYVVIDNVDAVTGQAKVGNYVAIPIQDTAQFADPDGNIRVTCKKGTHGDPTTCSNIGTGSGSAPTAPTLTLTAPTSPVTASGARVTWSSTGADACYGVSATPVGSPSAPAVTGWTKEWPKTNSSPGFSLDPVFSSMSANTTATYSFNLRCYSTATGIAGQTPIVAYTEQTKSVVLNKPSGTTGDWCDAYKSALSPTELAEFNTYNADNRGFTVETKTFVAHTGKTLGVDFGDVGPAGAPVLPGKQRANEYLSLSFSLPASGGTGKFALIFRYKTGSLGPVDHDIIATVSPCKGDFRPQNSGSETYLSPRCRTTYGATGQNIAGTRDLPTDTCPIPAGKTMYLNVSVRDLTDLSNTGSNDGTYLGCSPTQYCGKGTQLAN